MGKEINRHPIRSRKAGRKRTLNSCLPHMPEQGVQKSTSSLHPQFAYVESKAKTAVSHIF